MFCRHCGAKIAEGSRVCGACGAGVSAGATPDGPPPPGTARPSSGSGAASTAVPPQTSGLAVASFVLGIATLLTCGATAPFGVVLGIVALATMGGGGRPRSGRGLAIAGTCISGAGLVLPVLGILAGLLVPALAAARERARRTKCGSNLKQIGYALESWAVDNGKEFPPSLGALHPEYLDDPGVYLCPSAGRLAIGEGGDDLPPGVEDAAVAFIDRDTSYTYVHGLRTDDHPGVVVAYDLKGNHADGRNVLFVDGSVEWMEEAEFREALAETEYYLEPEEEDDKGGVHGSAGAGPEDAPLPLGRGDPHGRGVTLTLGKRLPTGLVAPSPTDAYDPGAPVAVVVSGGRPGRRLRLTYAVVRLGDGEEILRGEAEVEPGGGPPAGRERRCWDIRVDAPGNYRLIVRGADGGVLGARDFRIRQSW